jgi:2-amino-4-hydroxy-6-hydroxymethyldihydropteridine diphosphokinase
MAQVYLGLGTNIGNKAENLYKAIRFIEKRMGRIISSSAFYQTKPWGYVSDNTFLNSVVCVDTNILPLQILVIVQQIEAEMGRERDTTKRYEDRVIDIDILFYDDLVYSDKNHTLSIPHPLVEKRRFVLEPMNEIAPDFVHPVCKKTIRELHAELLKEEKDKNKPHIIKARAESFGHAFNGLKVLLRNEHNARIHILASILVIGAGIFFKISAIEWMLIIIAIGVVFICEIFNTVIEYLVDYISPTYHNGIKKIKDLSAAAVLIVAGISGILGLLIFIPKILCMFLH